jgi:hypothetical protein
MVVMDFEFDKGKNQIIDHKNHNTLDNRKDNLRLVNRSKNAKHRNGKNKNNKSGYRNVFWNKAKNKWEVHLQIDKKGKLLGSFKDVHEAGKFAEEMREKYYGKFKGVG